MDVRTLLKSICSAIAAYEATYYLGFLGMSLAGDGSGSDAFGYLFLSPIYSHSSGSYTALGPYLWACVFALMPTARKWYVVIIASIVTSIAYCGTANDLIKSFREAGTVSYALALFHKVPVLVAIVIGGYIMMQVIIVYKLYHACLRLKGSKTQSKS